MTAEQGRALERTVGEDEQKKHLFAKDIGKL